MWREQEPKKETGQSESILAKEFVEMILSIARENLKRDGSLLPALFLQLEGGGGGIVLLEEFPDTTRERQVYFANLGSFIRRRGKSIQEAVFVSEGWYVSTKEGESIDPEVRPSQHPGRKEVIAIAGRNADGTRQTFLIQTFSRDIELMPVLGEIEVAEYNTATDEKGVRTEGLVDYLFPKRAP